MLVTTTSSLDGLPVRTYLGIVSGEAINGANVIKDFFASITDAIGGRSGTMEKVFRNTREAALEEMAKQAIAMGANAVIGVDIDYEVMGAKNGMVMVTATGTAVIVQTR